MADEAMFKEEFRSRANMLASMEQKTLVLCFDGTGNSYSDTNTNVVKLFGLLDKKSHTKQRVYYEPGIGTYMAPGVVSPIFDQLAKTLDYAVAWYLYQHLCDGYRFIMQNYSEGDKICLFGFSRGAYTARALAGMLYKVGLLPQDNDQQIPFAYQLYQRTDKKGQELAKGFKLTHSRHVTIDFVGVWDTVSSVGALLEKDLPFTASNRAIRCFRHAMALDERRARFQPNPWHRTAPNHMASKRDPNHASSPLPTPGLDAYKNSFEMTDLPSIGSSTSTTKQRGPTSTISRVPKLFVTNEEEEEVKTEGVNPHRTKSSVIFEHDTDVLEVWFAGGHTDVGGGDLPNDTPNQLSDISLRWMVRQIIESGCPIWLNADQLASHGIIYLARDGQTGETARGLVRLVEAFDRESIKGKIHDALSSWKAWWIWWILEILPTAMRWQDVNNVWERKTWSNLGRGRQIHVPNPVFHESVRQRMRDPHLNYRPNAEWVKGTEMYVS